MAEMSANPNGKGPEGIDAADSDSSDEAGPPPLEHGAAGNTPDSDDESGNEA